MPASLGNRAVALFNNRSESFTPPLAESTDRRDDAPAGVLAAFAGVSCFLASIQVFCIGLGVARIGLNRPLAISVLVTSLILAWLFGTRFRDPSAAPTARPGLPRTKTPLFHWFLRILAACALLWAGWTWLQLWVLALLRSPYAFDGLAYHIPAIHDWVVQGGVGFVASTPDVPNVNFPMGVELSSFFAHFVFQTSRLLDACNLWYWPLAFTGLAVIASHLGARGIWCWLAGGLIFGASAFVSVSLTAYIDPGFASTVIGAVAASCVFTFHRRRRICWKATLLGINVGLMLGSKGFGLPFAMALTLVTVAGVFWVNGLKLYRVEALALTLAGAIIVAVGGYWYIRNLVVTGNPIHPVQLMLGQKVIAAGLDHRYWADLSIPEWLRQYPKWAHVFIAWLQLDAPIHFVYKLGGLGYIWVGGGLPAFIYLWFLAARRRQRELVVRLAYLSVLVLPLLAVTNFPALSLRTFWLHALGLPCLAVVLYDAASRWHRNRGHLLTLALGFAIVGVAVWECNRTLGLEWQFGRHPQAAGDRMVFGTSLEVRYPGLEEAPGFSEFLNADTVSRWRWQTSTGLLFGGVLAQPLGKRKIVVVPSAWTNWRDPYAESMLRRDPRAEDILLLQQARVRWILWDSRDGQQSPRSLTPYMQERYRWQTAGGEYLHLARLAWPEEAAALGEVMGNGPR